MINNANEDEIYQMQSNPLGKNIENGFYDFLQK